MITPEDLTGFIGTSQYYRYHNLLLTDGVKYFVDKAKAFWFIDIIWSIQNIIDDEDFAHITLTVKDNKAMFVATDGGKGSNPKVLYQQKIDYTDCPDGDWNFYKEGYVILLPSEH
jgi:hypothetical protein